MQQNNEKLSRLLAAMIERVPATRACSCASALVHARLE
jgi:hypothetical protein